MVVIDCTKRQNTFRLLLSELFQYSLFDFLTSCGGILDSRDADGLIFALLNVQVVAILGF